MMLFDKNSSKIKKDITGLETFIFDCDGVLWTGNKMITNANKVVKMLNKLKKKIIFLTNASTKTTDMLLQKFKQLKIPVQKENLIHAGLATSFYLNSLNLKENSKIYLIGSNNLSQTLKNNTKGLIISGLEDNHKTLKTFYDDIEYNLLLKEIKENTYDAVVVGWDNYFNTYKLAKASTILKYQKKCHFISSNNDFTAPFSPEIVMPASGSIISAIETASGRKAVCVGKPSKELGKNIISKFNLNPKKTLMVGDRIDSDLYFGNNAGFKTCIVLSGVTNLDMLHQLGLEEKPDYYATSISSFLKIDN